MQMKRNTLYKVYIRNVPLRVGFFLPSLFFCLSREARTWSFYQAQRDGIARVSRPQGRQEPGGSQLSGPSGSKARAWAGAAQEAGGRGLCSPCVARALLTAGRFAPTLLSPRLAPPAGIAPCTPRGSQGGE